MKAPLDHTPAFPAAPAPKGALRSKTIIGLALMLASTFGLAGMAFDLETGMLTINVYDVLDGLGVLDPLAWLKTALAAAIPGGAVLGWIGRRAARTAIKGLW